MKHVFNQVRNVTKGKMMKIIIAAVVVLCGVLSLPAHAQSLDAQINAVKQAHQNHRVIETQEKQKRQAEIQVLEDDVRRKERKQESYQDALDDLYLEERRIDVGKKRAYANRTNDYIDRDFKRQDAQIDLLKSRGEANRNYSSGAKDMMKGIGEGAKKSFK